MPTFMGQGHGTMAAGYPTSHSQPAMQASSVLTPAAPMSPFQFAGGGSPLFKTTGNEPVEAPPINAPSGMSPFSMTSASPTNLALTVGDVMNQLPPELVRGGALPAEQSINLPPTLLENALRSGQAAVPVFEIYRVCPALFQTPVSPQDPRTVALPAAKLPGLIASARHAGQSGAGMAGSPFAAATPAPASPFGAAPASPFSGMVSPFGMPAPQAAPAAEPARPPVAESAPPAPSVFPVSPFGTMASGPSTTPSQPLVPAPAPIFSPFAAQAATPPAPAAPEPALPAAPASPFAAMNGAMAAMPSPFAAAAKAAPATTPSPFAAAAPAQMPSFFTPAAAVEKAPEAQATAPAPSPFAAAAAVAPQPAIQAAASSPFAQNIPATPSVTGLLLPKNDTAAPPQVSGAKIKLSLAHALQGYSVEELGFDSKNIPSWVITQFDQSEIHQQAETGQSLVSLSTLIEGVSDIGFRNMLGGARRDFQIQLNPNELLHGQTQASPPASQNTAPPASVAPAMQTIQPAAPSAQGGMMTIMPSGAPSQAPTAPIFQNAAPAPAPEPAAPASPFAQAAFAPAPQAPAAQAPTAPLQPVMGAVNAFATAAATSPALSALPGMVKAFDPFAAATPKNEAPGLSSAQLLGQGASVPASFLPPAQGTQPLRDPFASKNTVHMPEAAPMTAEERKPTVPLFAAPEAAATASEPLTPMPAIQPLPVFFTPKDEPVAKPAAQPAAAPTASTSSVSRQSFLGLNPVDTETDQLLLRALLSTEETLDAKRVVEMVGSLPGLSACVCLHRSEVISHVDPSVTEAATFSHQAGDIARQLRALAPLIGIEGAETFTLNASGKLITFCFPGPVTVGVLHAGEPTTGLRDKVTLIARELARMLG